MSISSQDAVWSLGATRITVPLGATNAILIQPGAGYINTTIKYLSGGTCEILPVAFTAYAGSPDVLLSVAQNGATLAAISGSGYLLGTSEVLSISGQPSFYLSSTGATTILCALFGKGQGK